MKQHYQITGMTCNGCRTQVELLLKDIPAVIDASVNLEKSIATIQSQSGIELSTFRDVLPDKYTISQTEKEILSPIVEEQDISKSTAVKELFPLFLIFGYIVIAAIGINYKTWNLEHFMLDFMGLFYIVFSFFKLLDLQGFSQSFRMYDPLAKVLPGYGSIYPFIELVLGILFLTRFQIMVALIATVFILGITTLGVTKALINKKQIQCACLGSVLKLPMTKATFIENSIMLLMAVYMLSVLFLNK